MDKNLSFKISIIFVILIEIMSMLEHLHISDVEQSIDRYAYRDSVSMAIQLNKLDSIGIELKALKIDLYSVEE